MTPRWRWFLLGVICGFLLGIGAMVCAEVFYAPPEPLHTIMAKR